MTYNKNYHKRDLGEILFLLQRILNGENMMYNIRKFQDIMWNSLRYISEDEVLYENISEEKEDILLDLAGDLDLYGDNVPKSDLEAGIKDVNNPEHLQMLRNEVKTALEKLKNAK